MDLIGIGDSLGLPCRLSPYQNAEKTEEKAVIRRKAGSSKKGKVSVEKEKEEPDWVAAPPFPPRREQRTANRLLEVGTDLAG